MPRDFLESALINRTQKGPVRWDMLLTIGESGDPQDDPTLAWPKDRKELKAGTLTIASAMTRKGAGCEKINYDPLVMADGIAATDDPVLLFRSPSYDCRSRSGCKRVLPGSARLRRDVNNAQQATGFVAVFSRPQKAQ